MLTFIIGIAWISLISLGLLIAALLVARHNYSVSTKVRVDYK